MSDTASMKNRVQHLTWKNEELIPSKQRGYEAVGFLKPNGHAKQVLDSYNIKEENFNKYDFLVIPVVQMRLQQMMPEMLLLQ